MSAQALVNEPIPDDVPRAGAILAGAYRVEGVMGSGGMGLIVHATELASERRVAIKVMTAATAADPEQVARFRREAKAASSLASKHVVRVLDYGDLDTGLPYLVMEHLDGSSLADILKARGALPVAEAVHYVVQAIHGVAEAHVLGIIHRDLKPANLFLTGEPTTPVVKVLDFGASKLTSESNVDPSDPGGVTIASSLIGSPRYMAPEQIRSALEVDSRADVYALGATLHELLSGKPIFSGDTLARIFAQVLWDAPEPLSANRSDVPAGLAAVIAKCLAKSPDERFATVEALAAALAPFGASATESSTSPVAPPLPRRASLPKPSPASGSKLVASRLFKPVEAASPAETSRKPASASRSAVVLKATARMPRMKMASVPPKRTMKLAAFALAARLGPQAGAAMTAGSEGSAPIRTARMARFEPLPAAAAGTVATRDSRRRFILVLATLAVLLAALAAIAVVRRVKPSAPRAANASPAATAVTPGRAAK